MKIPANEDKRGSMGFMKEF